MVPVLRDGNPRRRHGLTSPYIGKLADADLAALDGLAEQAASVLRPWSGRPTPPTLLVGLAESSLMLAWFLWGRLGAADLCLSSRLPTATAGARRFEEPHSHGPQHHLSLPERRYARVVIIEDEITSGRTLQNLVQALADRGTVFEVITIHDLRSPAARLGMEVAFQATGLSVRITALADLGGGRRSLRMPTLVAEGPRSWRPEPQRAQAQADLDGLRTLAARHDVAAVFAVGEAIDLPLCLVTALPAARRPRLRHVTRSPWCVDDSGVRARLDLGPDAMGAPHFLYNPEGLPGETALVVGDASTAPVMAALCVHLRARGMTAIAYELDAGGHTG